MYVGRLKKGLLLALLVMGVGVFASEDHLLRSREALQKLDLFCVDPVQAICTPTVRQRRHRQAVDEYKKRLKEAVIEHAAKILGTPKERIEHEVHGPGISSIHAYYFKQIDLVLKSPDIRFGEAESKYFENAVGSQMGKQGNVSTGIGRFVHKLRFHDSYEEIIKSDNFAVIKYPDACGKDGLKENASLLNTTNEPYHIMLCPGFLAAAKNYRGRSPRFYEAAMFATLMHEASHSLDVLLHSSNKDYDANRLSCLYNRYGSSDAEVPWENETEFRMFTTEISADAWAAEILRQRIDKIDSVWKRFQFVSDSLQSLCKSQKWGRAHPIGSFRIKHIFARALGVSLGCETKPMKAEPFCAAAK